MTLDILNDPGPLQAPCWIGFAWKSLNFCFCKARMSAKEVSCSCQMEWRDHVLPATHGASDLWCENRMMNAQGTRTWSFLWLIQGLQNFREWYHFTRVAIYFDPWSLDEFQPLELGGWATCKKALATFGPSWWNMYIYINTHIHILYLYIYMSISLKKNSKEHFAVPNNLTHVLRFYAQF